ncbi:hypothetical protein SAMN04489841_3296 [Natrinema salaciae]|uniref:Uncharacterized protein n=1 Tax=Natrinema salaciae TaxID=1186196 RepID=A0A1H9MC83_9EURY|nr:hypothetical protein SAMN04489841_3296 [Natrinema salaciae]
MTQSIFGMDRGTVRRAGVIATFVLFVLFIVEPQVTGPIGEILLVAYVLLVGIVLVSLVEDFRYLLE